MDFGRLNTNRYVSGDRTSFRTNGNFRYCCGCSTDSPRCSLGLWILNGIVLCAGYLWMFFCTSKAFSSCWSPRTAEMMASSVEAVKTFQNPPYVAVTPAERRCSTGECAALCGVLPKHTTDAVTTTMRIDAIVAMVRREKTFFTSWLSLTLETTLKVGRYISTTL